MRLWSLLQQMKANACVHLRTASSDIRPIASMATAKQSTNEQRSASESEDEAATTALTPRKAADAHALQPHESKDNFIAWSQLLATLPHLWRPGKTNSVSQPNVELLVVTLNDMPLNAEKFADMCGGKEWVIFNFVVLAVGPPGFSSVPYNSGVQKKGAPRPDTKHLYDCDDNGNTRFYPFEKSPQNRDRGERISTMRVEGSDEPVDATTVVEVGTCMSMFMRQDNFSAGSSLFTGDTKDQAVLPAHSLFALVLKSNNSEQALKGQGIKICTGKTVPPGAMLGVFAGIPQREEDAHAVAQRCRAHPPIANVLMKDTVKVFACRPDTVSHATTDEETGLLVLCNASPDLPEVFFTWAQLEQLFGMERSLALKLFNVAIALKALRLLVLRDDRPASDGRQALSVSCMAVDWNDLLHMHAVNGLEEWPSAHASWDPPFAAQDVIASMVTACGTVLWCCPCLPLITAGKRMVCWSLRLAEDKAVLKENDSGHFVTDETEEQGGHALDLYLAPQDVSFGILFREFTAMLLERKQQAAKGDKGLKTETSTLHLRHQMRLRFKPERKGATGRKKRASIEWD